MRGGGLGPAVGEDGGEAGEGGRQEAGPCLLSQHLAGLRQHKLHGEWEEVAQGRCHPIGEVEHGEQGGGPAAQPQPVHKLQEQRLEVLQTQPENICIWDLANKQTTIVARGLKIVKA